MRERVYTQKNTRKKKRNKNNDAQKKAAVSGNFRSRVHAKKKRCTKKRGVRGECESACTQTACTKCTKKEMVKKERSKRELQIACTRRKNDFTNTME